MNDHLPERKGDKISIEGDYQFNAYYSGRRPQRFWHYTKLREAQNELAAGAGDRILDAGCGSGLLAWFLAKDTPAEVWGTDANPSAIDFCRTKFALPNLRFSLSLIDELPFGDGFFNKIAFLEVIEHISPAQGLSVLRTFHDLLVPGGKLVISTPNRKSAWPLIEFLLDKLKLVPTLAKEQHEWLYSGKELIKAGEQAGFQCLSKKTINFLSPWAAAIHWRLGLTIHELELKTRSCAGSLLLYTFIKPDNHPGSL